MMRGGDSTQYGARFITGFIGFRLRNRVQHDSGARLYGGDTVLHQRGADNNTGVQIAVGGEVTDSAAIAPRRCPSASAINCMARTFGAPLRVPMFMQAR